MTGQPDVTEVPTLAAELLDDARRHPAQRSARTIVTGTEQRATLIALVEGAQVAEHDAPPAATLYVVSGKVHLHTHDREWTLDTGQLVKLPAQRHGLRALTDAAVLLTVALH